MSCVTLTAVLEGPRLFPSEDPVEDAGVDHAAVQAKVIVERRPDVSYSVQLLPHPRLLQVVRIFRRMES